MVLGLAWRAPGRPGRLAWTALGLLVVVTWNDLVLRESYCWAEREWLRRKGEQIVQPQEDWISFLLEDVLVEMAATDAAAPAQRGAVTTPLASGVWEDALAYELWRDSAVHDLGVPCLVEVLDRDGRESSLYARGFLRDLSYEVIERGEWWSLAESGADGVGQDGVRLQQEVRRYPTGQEHVLRGEIPRADDAGWLRVELPVMSRRLSTLLAALGAAGDDDADAQGYRPRQEVDRPVLLLRGARDAWLDVGFGGVPAAEVVPGDCRAGGRTPRVGRDRAGRSLVALPLGAGARGDRDGARGGFPDRSAAAGPRGGPDGLGAARAARCAAGARLASVPRAGHLALAVARRVPGAVPRRVPRHRPGDAGHGRLARRPAHLRTPRPRRSRPHARRSGDHAGTTPGTARRAGPRAGRQRLHRRAAGRPPGGRAPAGAVLRAAGPGLRTRRRAAPGRDAQRPRCRRGGPSAGRRAPVVLVRHGAGCGRVSRHGHPHRSVRGHRGHRDVHLPPAARGRPPGRARRPGRRRADPAARRRGHRREPPGTALRRPRAVAAAAGGDVVAAAPARQPLGVRGGQGRRRAARAGEGRGGIAAATRVAGGAHRRFS